MSGPSSENGEAPDSLAGDPPRPAPAASFADRWSGWRRDPRLVTAGLGLVALVAGAWWVRVSVSGPSGALAATNRSSPTSTGSVARRATGGTAAPRASTTTLAVFVVDVVGAVRHAGVVSLPGSARVIDAVAAAGGALPTADLDRLNLAAHLVDGMRIAVPRRGVGSDPAGPTSDPGAAPAAGASGAGGPPTPSTPLDLNTATETQLEALPGIGPSLAQAIVSEREREGGFHTVDDLRRVRGIGDVRFAQLRLLVTV